MNKSNVLTLCIILFGSRNKLKCERLTYMFTKLILKIQTYFQEQVHPLIEVLPKIQTYFQEQFH